MGEERWRRAKSETAEKQAYLRQVANEVPEYADILHLFIEVLSYLEGREGRTGITLKPSYEHMSEKVAAGFPLLAVENLHVDPVAVSAFLYGVVEVMLKVGRDGGEDLKRLRRALDASELDLGSLLRGCLARDRKPLQEAAERTGVPAALLEFSLEQCLKPALRGFALGVDPAIVSGWKEGSCPICGSRAGMAELVGDEGRRQLCCSTCSFTWSFPRISCPYCGAGDSEKLSYLDVGNGPVRIDLCSCCSRYIKTRDSRKGNAGVPLDAEDLVTLHLDIIAGRRGYERGK